jgi:hypothetical protein
MAMTLLRGLSFALVAFTIVAVIACCYRRDPDYAGMLSSRLGSEVGKASKVVYVNGDTVSIIACQMEALVADVEDVLQERGWHIDAASEGMIEASIKLATGTQDAKLLIKRFETGRALWVYAESGEGLSGWFKRLLVKAAKYEQPCKWGHLPSPVWE